MRHKSPTNSHKHQDRELRQLYADANPFDEVTFWTGIDFDDMLRPRKMWEGLVIDAADVNHIFSFGRRPDLKANLISLSRSAHRFFHANLKIGRLLCLLAKCRKAERTGDPEEFSLPDMDFCAGRSVQGFVLCLDVPELWLQDMKAELVSRMAMLAAATGADRGED